MRYVEDKGCYNNHGPTQEIPNNSAVYSEFHKGKDATTRIPHHHRTTMGKPTPSKWDDAQKWLVGLSKGGEKSHSKNRPRNSNADDLRLIAPVPQKEHDYSSSEKEEEDNDASHDLVTTSSANAIAAQYEADAKRVECDDSNWRNSIKPSENTIQVQSICFRDMGTEMTPIASQEPSRTGTPIRATTPATRSPIHSGTSTPMRGQNGLQVVEVDRNTARHTAEGSTSPCKRIEDQARKLSPLESRAMAWDEAERAKYMARFKREEVKIQAWENHQIRKAEMEMKKMEVKAERMKALAQERFANKLASTKRVAEEKRANAQVKLNDKALRTTERVEYIRRTGHVPSSFSFNFKLPSMCW
ncbi:uncharacterized protein LOC124848075 [Vigna umbellata]|uniref:uncharacterized protein LOC124848075 n=1 Tax=Vigna umbellata TaxID=87088 RepID=UPI001F5FA3D1|nr:uncharacterized protein LOC124848075 [Vigna umbellata]XP_047181643.1 uncharacterized protein LOC124848075 [Vigna umbellata]XP_047181644.1 uncharacterized protein LOC124848075 [Vigna umbellata]